LIVTLLFGCIDQSQKESNETVVALPDYTCSDCNVLLITLETFRADHVTSMGYSRNITPELDDFGRENILFENAFTQSSWTTPSLASILTSLYPSEHGVINPKAGISENYTTITEILNEGGYYTYYNYKAWFPLNELGFEQGFKKQGRGGSADIFKNQALKVLREHKDEKSFIWLHIEEPHQPYNPPDGYDDLFIKDIPQDYRETTRFKTTSTGRVFTAKEMDYLHALHDGEIKYMDEQLGGLIDGIKDLGIYDKTIIVIIADHGEEFSEHGATDHGHTQYDELIHVPMFMHIPSIKKSTRIKYQVRSIDILPTILDILDIPGYTASGASLIPMLFGRENQDRIVYSEAIHPQYGPELKAVRFKGHKLIYRPKTKKFDENYELYDIINDVNETSPLDLDNAIRGELELILDDFLTGNIAKYKSKEVEYDEETLKRLREIGYLE